MHIITADAPHARCCIGLLPRIEGDEYVPWQEQAWLSLDQVPHTQRDSLDHHPRETRSSCQRLNLHPRSHLEDQFFRHHWWSCPAATSVGHNFSISPPPYPQRVDTALRGSVRWLREGRPVSPYFAIYSLPSCHAGSVMIDILHVQEATNIPQSAICTFISVKLGNSNFEVRHNRVWTASMYQET